MKLKYINNWESDEYFVGKHKLTHLKEVSIGDKTYKVNTREVGVEYYDHGHKYIATSWHYFIKERVFGITYEFDLNTLVDRVDITPVIFK